MGSIPLVHSFQDPRAALAIQAFYGILLLASMSVLYQRYGNKNAATRDVSKQNGSMDHRLQSDIAKMAKMLRAEKHKQQAKMHQKKLPTIIN